MRDADKARFATVMYWLAKKYPVVKGRGTTREEVPRELTREELADWFEALQDLTIERVELGAKWYYGHKSFFPKPGELREAAEQVRLPPLPSLPQPERKPDNTPPDVRMRQVDELFCRLERKFGTSQRARRVGHG